MSHAGGIALSFDEDWEEDEAEGEGCGADGSCVGKTGDFVDVV